MSKNKPRKILIFLFFSLTFVLVLAFIAFTADRVGNKKELNRLKAQDFEFNHSLGIIADNGFEGNKRNSYISIKKTLNLGCDGALVDLSFKDNTIPVLASKPKQAEKENVVELEHVMKYYTNYSKSLLCLNLKEFSNLSAIVSLAAKYELTERILYFGIDSDSADFVKRKNPDIDFYFEIKPQRNKETTEDYAYSFIQEAQALGAVGISCRADLMNESLAQYINESGLSLALITKGDELGHYKALSYSPLFIITKQPQEFYNLLKRIN